MLKKFFSTALMVSLVTGCSTYTPQRYSISADNNVAIKRLNVMAIGVGNFEEPKSFDDSCRAAGPIAPPDGLGFAEYIKKALEDELKVAGVYSKSNPKTQLSGSVESLSFSSSRGLTGGAWDISLKINSSNGQSMVIGEHYEFESGFVADTACKQTAEAYLPAVQNLIGKIVSSPKFPTMLE